MLSPKNKPIETHKGTKTAIKKPSIREEATA
jgi:hypothetical protein